MTEWFDLKLYREAVEPLMNERMRKRLVSRESPDTRVLREAMRSPANTSTIWIICSTTAAGLRGRA